MNRRIDWGAGILILLLIAGGLLLFYSQYQELKQLIQESAEADKLLEDNNKPIAENEPPRVVADAEVTPENVIIENDFNSLSDEEKVQRQKALNQMIIDRISDRADWKEIYQIMTENEYPYSPEVEVQLQNAYMRMEQSGAVQDAKDKERRAKLAKEVEELIHGVRITKY